MYMRAGRLAQVLLLLLHKRITRLDLAVRVLGQKY